MVAELVRASISGRSNLYSKVEGSNSRHAETSFRFAHARARIIFRDLFPRIILNFWNDVIQPAYDVISGLNSQSSRWMPNLLFGKG